MTLVKNTDLILPVTDTDLSGTGICRTEDGQVVLVQGALTGELVEARIIKVLKNRAIGKLLQVVQASPHRLEPDCPVYGKCGGCAFRHLSYEEECRIKTKYVADCMRRIGGFAIEIPDVLKDESVLHYRNKAQIPVGAGASGELVTGFYGVRSHRIVGTDSCPIQLPAITKTVRAVKKWASRAGVIPYDEVTGRGLLRHIVVRVGEATGQVMAVLVINGKAIPHSNRLIEILTAEIPGIASVVLNTNTRMTNVIMGRKNFVLWGAPYIEDRLHGLRFRLSPNAFYQVNRRQTLRLYETAKSFADLKGHETVLDLYCGIGTIGLYLARSCKKVLGAEIVAEAVEDAKANAAANGIDNASFFRGDAAAVAAILGKEGLRPDVIVVDPPRKGCDGAAIQAMTELNPRKIVYVSCDPATLARDCKLLAESGYSVEKAQPVDLFARTGHVETVVLITKKND